MHLNVAIKNVSWPHFSWATLYIHSAQTVGDFPTFTQAEDCAEACGRRSEHTHFPA